MKKRIFDLNDNTDATWDKLKRLGLVRKWGKEYKQRGITLCCSSYYADDLKGKSWGVTWIYRTVAIVDTEEEAIKLCKRLVIKSLKTRQE